MALLNDAPWAALCTCDLVSTTCIAGQRSTFAGHIIQQLSSPYLSQCWRPQTSRQGRHPHMRASGSKQDYSYWPLTACCAVKVRQMCGGRSSWREFNGTKHILVGSFEPTFGIPMEDQKMQGNGRLAEELLARFQRHWAFLLPVLNLNGVSLMKAS